MSGKNTVAEFIEELTRIETEIRLLNDDKKQLVEDYKEKINMKALMAAIRIAKIRAKLGDNVNDCDIYLDEVDGKVE